MQLDTWTQGEWVGRFGADGYVLSSFSNASAGTAPDVASLPAYIASFRSSGRSATSWISPNPNADARALQAPAGGSGRAIGCWFSGYSDFVDVWMDAAAEAAGKWYQLAAYAVDYDNGDPTHDGFLPRRQTVELLNMHTLEAAAPTLYLDSYVGGTWIVWQLNTSARVRFSQLQGDNNVLSAIMFDPVA